MKRLLLIVILTTFGALKADLINGPYSPESQELVRIIENQTPIFGSFMILGKKISILRELFKQAHNTDNFYQNFIEKLPTYKNQHNLINDPLLVEAYVQLLKTYDTPQEKTLQKLKISRADYPLFTLGQFALAIKNIDLLDQVIEADASVATKNALLKLAEYNHMFDASARDSQVSAQEWVNFNDAFDFDADAINTLLEREE